MMPDVKFQPQNFGGYTLSILLSGGFMAMAFTVAWYNIIASIIMFFIGMYFYSQDNGDN